MTALRRFDAAQFCMDLACAPETEWPDLIGGDKRRQEVADHFLAVANECPKPTVEQLAVVRAVFRQAHVETLATQGAADGGGDTDG